MDKKSSIVLFGILPVVYLILAFIYINLAIQPTLYFHHAQSPFILSPDFLIRYLRYPGGSAELIANLFMQFFYIRYLGSIVFFSISLFTMLLTYNLMNVFQKSKLNIIWSLAPFTFTIALANDYSLPYSIIISIILVMLFLLLVSKFGKSPIRFIIGYTAGAIITYYICGSGYLLLFSAGAIMLSTKFKLWVSLLAIVFILGFTSLFPLVAYYLFFAIPLHNKYLYFFPAKLYFMAYRQLPIFYIYLLSVPVLLFIACITTKFKKHQKPFEQNDKLFLLKTFFVYAVILSATFYSHLSTYRVDEKKIVASDYYCYNNNAEQTAKAAISLKDYNFIANLNYNLVLSKTGRLSEDFFGFLQMSGSDALHPDNEFLAERAFIAADFYYQLGYISEARHWAYEALVFYPYSIRALQILVKIHFVTHEYVAAKQYLNILNKMLIDRSFVKEFMPYVKDTLLINNNIEIIEKRRFIPAEHELNPLIDQRFKELLEANKKNKNAYEHLMLYYLLDSQLENFLELYKDAGNYFDKPLAIYEEALLLYYEMNHIPLQSQYKISQATVDRFNDFNHTLMLNKGNARLSRNILYQKYGKSYLFYFHFIYPYIIKPEIINEDDEIPSI